MEPGTPCAPRMHRRGVNPPPNTPSSAIRAISLPSIDDTNAIADPSLLPEPLQYTPPTPRSISFPTAIRESAETSGIAGSAPTSQHAYSIRSLPAPPVRVAEDWNDGLKQAILDNAQFLFPTYMSRDLKIAVGLSGKGTYSAFVYVIEKHQAHPGAPSSLTSTAKVLLGGSPGSGQGQAECVSRVRALEALLKETERRVGRLVAGLAAKEGASSSGGSGSGSGGGSGKSQSPFGT